MFKLARGETMDRLLAVLPLTFQAVFKQVCIPYLSRDEFNSNIKWKHGLYGNSLILDREE